MRSSKVKNFSLSMFDDQAKLIQKKRNNVITTKEE